MKSIQPDNQERSYRPAFVPIAVVAAACRLPGADNLQQFWKMLVEGRSGITEVGPEYLNREIFYEPKKSDEIRGRTYSALGGLIPRRPTDPPLSGAAPDANGEVWDPCHLILADVAADAWSKVQEPKQSTIDDVGVYVGHSAGSALAGELSVATLAERIANEFNCPDVLTGFSESDRNRICDQLTGSMRQGQPRRLDDGGPNYLAQAAAGLIAGRLKLSGPRMVIDAACASSLVALSQAAQAIVSGKIRAAIVAGASYFKFESSILFSQAQSCSAHGSRPFDAEADGLINAEGFVAIAVKALDDALADGDEVIGVIRGIGLSSDGKGRSLWAPRKEGQKLALDHAYACGVDPASVQYLEAHATSTLIGDATETTALGEFFQGRAKTLPIGSVKSNIGHTLETAGLAGFLKVILAMKHGVVPPTINVQRLSPEIPWDCIPLEVVTSARPWPDVAGHPRRAAVNAFGIGGLNVHVVVDGPLSPASPVTTGNGQHSLPRLNGAQHVAKSRKVRSEPLAIIGRGAVTAGAFTFEKLKALVASGKSVIGDAPLSRWKNSIGLSQSVGEPWTTTTNCGGYIVGYEYDWRIHRIPPNQIAQANPLQFMLLDATQQALVESGYDRRPFPNEEAAVVVGSIFGGEFSQELQIGLRMHEILAHLSKVLKKRGLSARDQQLILDRAGKQLLRSYSALLDITGSFTSSTLASRIGKTLNFMGGALALDAGNCSGLVAIDAASNLLSTGAASMVVCAAAHRDMTLPAFEQWVKLEEFGHRRTGDQRSILFPGEGVAVLLLKTLKQAEADGDQIRGVVEEIRSRRSVAKFKPVPTTATVRDPLTSPVTQQIGHLQGASGIIESLVALESNSPADKTTTIVVSSRDFVVEATVSQHSASRSAPQSGAEVVSNSAAPQHLAAPLPIATSGLKQPARQVSAAGSSLDPAVSKTALSSLTTATHPAPETSSGSVPDFLQPKRESPVISQQTLTSAVSRSVGSHRLTTVAASSLADLRQMVAEATYESIAPEAPSLPWRLAIAGSAAQFGDQRQKALDWLQNPTRQTKLNESGIFVSPVNHTSSSSYAAALFPGQGSQRAGMLNDLILGTAECKALLTEIDQLLIQKGQRPTTPWFCGYADLEAHDILATQISMLAADLLALTGCRVWGIEFDRLLGHSFGEYAALVAAGALTLEESLDLTIARAEAVAAVPANSGAMLSIAATSQVVLDRLARGRLEVYLSHCNAPLQTVVAGPTSEIARLAAELKADGIAALTIPVGQPFHTPLMAAAKPQFEAAVRLPRWQPPGIPVLSSVSNRFVADRTEIMENLVEQLTAPLNFSSLIDRLWEEGTRLFIEVGPGQVLTKLVRQIIGVRDGIVICVDQPSVALADRQAYLMAAKWVVGGELLTGSKPVSRLQSYSTTTKPAGPQSEATVAPSSRKVLSAPAPGSHAKASQPPVTGVGFAVELVAENAFSPSHTPLSANNSEHELSVVHSNGQAESQPAAAEVVFSVGSSDSASSPEQPVRRGRAQLERLVIDLVVEFTGFPAEEIELDWDLEADLGIDSIRRMQLLGELREYFDFPSANDAPTNIEWRTLRQIIDFLETLPGKSSWLDDDPAFLEDEPATSQLSTAILDSDEGNSFAVSDALTSSPPPSEVSVDVDDSTTFSQRDDWSVSEFLVDFVVDRTGFPREIVDFDADLEADLGIDSISKAQLFGELREQFGLGAGPTSSETNGQLLNHGLTLGSIRTLGQIRDMVTSHLDPEATDNPAVTSSTSEEAGTSEKKSTDFPCLNQYRSQLVTALVEGAEKAEWYESSIATIDLPPELTEELFAAVDAGQLSQYSHAANLSELQLEGLVARLRPSHSSKGTGKPATIAPTTRRSAPPPIEWHNTSPTTISRRFRLAMFPLPQVNPDPCAPDFAGNAIVVGDSKVSDALVAYLKQLGVTVELVRRLENIDTARSIVESLWQRGRAPHLFVTTPRDPDAETGESVHAWNRRREQGIRSLFWFCERWLAKVNEAGLTNRASIIAAISTGGDFASSHQVTAAESGAVAGLIKAIIVESWMKGFRKMANKIIDTPADESPEQIAKAMCAELAVPSYNVEIGWHNGQRSVLRAYPETAAEAAVASDRPAIVPSGHWIATGGARGITAFSLMKLAKEYPQIKLHLLGTAPAPTLTAAQIEFAARDRQALKAQIMRQGRSEGRSPFKAWQEVEKALEIGETLAAMRATGIEAWYHCCNVSNRDSVAAVLESIRHEHGSISGVIHGAGIGKDASFEKKEVEHVEKCLGAKLDGTFHLMTLTRNDPLQAFIGFGSISGRFGANGHTDYSLANDMLAKLAGWYRRYRPDVPATVFHWHAWGDVGMATKPETKLALEMIDMQFMPAMEGVGHIINEFQAGLPRSEVLITDDRYFQKFYSLGRFGELPDQPENTADWPLLTEVSHADELTAQIPIDPLRDPFLTDHRLDGRPLLPMVILSEILAEGFAAAHAKSRPFVFENFAIRAPYKCFSDDRGRLSLRIQKSEKGHHATLFGEVKNRQGRVVDSKRLLAEARFTHRTDRSTPAAVDPRTMLADQDWIAVTYPPSDAKLTFGTSMQCLEKVKLDEQAKVIWAQIYSPGLEELAGPHRDVTNWQIPSAVLDASLVASAWLLWHVAKAQFSLPLAIRSLSVVRHPRPAEKCFAKSTLLSVSNDKAMFDVVIYGPDGEPVIWMDGYEVAWLLNE